MRLVAGILVIVMMLSGAAAQAEYAAAPYSTGAEETLDPSGMATPPCMECEEVSSDCVRVICDLSGITAHVVRRIPSQAMRIVALKPGTTRTSGINPAPSSPPPRNA